MSRSHEAVIQLRVQIIASFLIRLSRRYCVNVNQSTFIHRSDDVPRSQSCHSDCIHIQSEFMDRVLGWECCGGADPCAAELVKRICANIGAKDDEAYERP
jgi:hypothetical protein